MAADPELMNVERVAALSAFPDARTAFAFREFVRTHMRNALDYTLIHLLPEQGRDEDDWEGRAGELRAKLVPMVARHRRLPEDLLEAMILEAMICQVAYGPDATGSVRVPASVLAPLGELVEKVMSWAYGLVSYLAWRVLAHWFVHGLPWVGSAGF